MSNSDRPIPIPLPNRARYLLTEKLQGWLFLLTVAAVIGIWLTQSPGIRLRGQVASEQIVVSAPRDGFLEPSGPSLQPFASVQQNITVLASIDVSDALLEMQTLTAQRERLQAELTAKRNQLRQEQMRWQWDIEQQRLQQERHQANQRQIQLSNEERVDQLTNDLVDLGQQRRSLQIKIRENQATMQRAQITIDALTAKQTHLRRLVQLRMTPETELHQIETELELSQQTVAETSDLSRLLDRELPEVQQQFADVQARLSVASKQLAAQSTRVPSESASGPMMAPSRTPSSANPSADPSELQLQPFVQAIAVQDARIRELAHRIATNQIHSPISGSIAQVHQRPGTFVRSGDPIVTIATNQNRYVIAYLDESIQSQIEPESTVSIQLPGESRLVGTSTVSDLGLQIESVPTRFDENNNVPRWGLPIKIPLPEDSELIPGQLVDLVIH